MSADNRDSSVSAAKADASSRASATCLCGGRQFKVVMSGQYRWFLAQGQAVPFRALRCKKCGLVVTDPPPSTSYEADECDDADPPPLIASSKHRIRRLRPHLTARSRVLEIGCSTGALVAEATRCGVLESVGVELSQPKAAFGRSLGRDIRDVPVEECGFANEYFDVVQAHHTLEHVRDAHGFLNTVHQVLKPGGIFYLTQARHRSPFVRSAQWQGWFPQEHYWHFTETTLANLLGQHGFRLMNYNCPLHSDYATAPGPLAPAKKAFKTAVKVLRLGDMVDALFRRD